jgi:hypothetical protein
VQVCEGETIRGTLSCKPNAKNPRDLDIVLEYHFEGKHCEAHRTQVRPAVAGVGWAPSVRWNEQPALRDGLVCIMLL